MRPLVVHWLEHYLRPDLASELAPTWFMCVGFAGLAGLILMLVLARRRGIESGTVASVVFWGYLAAVVAGIVVPMTIDAIERAVATGHVQLRWAGMTSFWGYLAGAGAVALVCRRDRVPLARIADLAAIPIGGALVFARLGCFMAGCDYGKVTALPWAVRFPAGSPAWRDQVHAGLISSSRVESLPVHPTQLYEAALGLVIVAVAWVVARRVRSEGRVFFAAAATYAIGRLVIETLRGDAGRGIYAGLSSGQIFCILVLLAIASRLVLARRLAAVGVMAAGLLVAGNVHAQPAAGSPTTTDSTSAASPGTADSASGASKRSDSTSGTADSTSAASPGTPDSTSAASPTVSDAYRSDTTDAPETPVFDPPPAPPPPEIVARPLRPIFAVGALLGGATALNRPGEQVPDLSGASLSLGYIPGRFGLWFDLDKLSNHEASHDTAIASVSFAPRVTPHLWIGARAGIGVTRVSFMSSAFAGVTASDVRIDAVAEYVMNHNWVLWFRPLTIDVVSAAELGGPITTLQFRAGVAYRFGERGR